MRSRIVSPGISRRSLLIGGGAGVGLLVAWGLWPRAYQPNLAAGEDEAVFNAFLKIGSDGRVIVAVPQAEIGQGVYTSLPQIIADELGADWRTVAVEPAPVSPLYANTLLTEEQADGAIARWWAGEDAQREAFMFTGASNSVRLFEPKLREAGAAARSMLMMAAARRWDAEWETLDVKDGFVLGDGKRLSFGQLAAEAAGFDPPDYPQMRGGSENRLVGEPLPRLDLPSKVDGSAQFAADVRLPGMVFASVRQGPRGTVRLARIDRKAASGIPGLVTVVEKDKWVAAIASNWWAANQAIEALKPAFETEGALVSSEAIDAALAKSLEDDAGSRMFEQGDVEDAFEGQTLLSAFYEVGLAASAPIEPLTATARMGEEGLEIWAPVQAPSLARSAAARAAGLSEEDVTLYQTLIGSGYGRKAETIAVEQAAELGRQLKRPVQLSWSRVEETAQDHFRAPAQASLKASIGANRAISGWQARIAAPAAAPVWDRLRGDGARTDAVADASAVAGAAPPYDIASIAVDHLPADIGLTPGLWRSGAHSYTCFFTESFVDEIARAAMADPLAFRMQMLGKNPRLARVLSTAAALGGWDGGGSGSNMGLACHAAFGSYIALLVEAESPDGQQIRVTRAMAAVDCGRVINPTIVRQLVEGGIIHGLSAALGPAIRFEDGLPTVRHFGGLKLARLGHSPEVSVEIIASEEEPGGVTELAVPPVAPAIANAIFAVAGRRMRSLPFNLAEAE